MISFWPRLIPSKNVILTCCLMALKPKDCWYLTVDSPDYHGQLESILDVQLANKWQMMWTRQPSDRRGVVESHIVDSWNPPWEVWTKIVIFMAPMIVWNRLFRHRIPEFQKSSGFPRFVPSFFWFKPCFFFWWLLQSWHIDGRSCAVFPWNRFT